MTTHLQDSPNPEGIMSSKASGEPCLMLSAGVLAALQNAVADARSELAPPGQVCVSIQTYTTLRHLTRPIVLQVCTALQR